MISTISLKMRVGMGFESMRGILLIIAKMQSAKAGNLLKVRAETKMKQTPNLAQTGKVSCQKYE